MLYEVITPLLDIDYKGATGALIHITGGPDLTLGEANRIGEGITNSMDQNANVIWGARLDPEMEGAIRVMAIITGVKSPNIIGGGKSPQKIIPKSANRTKGSLGIDYIV